MPINKNKTSMPSKQRSSSGSGGTSPPSYNAVTNSKEKGDRRRQQFERQISAGQIRLRSGSAGHRPLKNEEPDMDEEHEPIEVSFLMSCLKQLS